MTHTQVSLRLLISQDMYVVDEHVIASAIIARASVHATVAGASFHSDRRTPTIRARRARAGQPRRPR